MDGMCLPLFIASLHLFATAGMPSPLFLNSFLPLEDEQEVIEIEYLSPELVPATPLGKLSVVDVRCTDNHGGSFIVEMQSEWTNIFRKRLIVNGSKATIRQLDKKSVEEKA